MELNKTLQTEQPLFTMIILEDSMEFPNPSKINIRNKEIKG